MCQKLCYMTIRREYKGGKTEDVSIKGTLCTPPPASPAQQGCPGPGVTAVPAQASVQPPRAPRRAAQARPHSQRAGVGAGGRRLCPRPARSAACPSGTPPSDLLKAPCGAPLARARASRAAGSSGKSRGGAFGPPVPLHPALALRWGS